MPPPRGGFGGIAVCRTTMSTTLSVTTARRPARGRRPLPSTTTFAAPLRSDRRALDYDNVFKCWYNGGGGTHWRQIRDFYKVASKTMDRDYQINPDKPSVVRAEEAYEEYFTRRGGGD